ncbi:MAP/microtubule affinity-regulating kinase 3 [Durusdinium trenchii]|uniref:MAP/microtubule affinity-regulating kinase 3 n=1 Tax=Durusdinium trenchii TaxID=1381693 RepID=A0ABP0M659_9DINO
MVSGDGVGVKPALLEELSTARGSSKVSSNGSEREAPSEAPAEVDGKLDGLEERQLGCQFGSFRLLKRLGQGSQGRVYVGRDATGDVAVKITQLNKKHLIDRFNREVEIMKLLSHKSIVQLVSVHWEGQLAGLVMPLAEGDLLQAISNSERRRLRESEGRHVFRQLLDGVEHMHSHQIIHRDLKLENILINSKEERVKIIFGGQMAVKTERWLFRLKNSPIS